MTSSDDGARGSAPALQLKVLGQFALRRTDLVRPSDLPVSRAGQRLLAFLALHQRPVARSWVTSLLWGDSDERHGSWSLRSTLHRLPKPLGSSPVQATQSQLTLAPAVDVDVVGLTRRSVRWRAERTTADAADPAPTADAADTADAGDDDLLDHIASLEHDVLPDWHDDWVVVERERHRQLRLHALEALARRLTHRGRYGMAIHAGLAAVKAEPLRESAHRAVIAAHLAEGNVADALRQYGACRRQLLQELGISPSRSMQHLVFGRGEAGARESASS